MNLIWLKMFYTKFAQNHNTLFTHLQWVQGIKTTSFRVPNNKYPCRVTVAYKLLFQC